MTGQGSQTPTAASLALLTVAVIAVFSVWLGRLDLMDPDEGRHSEIAREMLVGGHLLTPRIHEEPYYDKPAMFYWMLASSFAAFGETATAARLPSVVAAVTTVAATAYLAGLAYGARAGAAAALVLASTLGFVAVGRHTMVDMPFTAALWLALVFLARTVLAGKEARSPYPFYIATGLAVLLKGPAALVLLGSLALVGTFISGGPGRGLAKLRPLGGAALVLALVLPWYLAAWFADPDYIETFLVHHNLVRYTAVVSSSHAEPWYYYAVALPLFALPWSPVMAVAALARLRKHTRGRADLLLGAWVLIVIGFFAPAKTKLVTYMLPALPALACMSGAWLVSVSDSNRPAVKFLGGAAVAWAIFVAVLSGGAVAWLMFAGAISPWFLLVAVAAAAVAVASLSWQKTGKRTRLPGAVAASTLCLLAWVYGGASVYVNAERSMRPAAELLRELGPDARALAYRCPGHSMAFYAGRPVPRIDDPTEALALLDSGGPRVLMTKEKHLGDLDLDSVEGLSELWRGARSRIMFGKTGDQGMAERGGSRTLRRPQGPTSRF